jgi:hypothetical protein
VCLGLFHNSIPHLSILNLLPPINNFISLSILNSLFRPPCICP